MTTGTSKTRGGKPATLEGALKRLEELVTLMNGDCSIDDAIALYAEAVKLIEFAGGKLSAAKLKVEKLSAGKEKTDEKPV